MALISAKYILPFAIYIDAKFMHTRTVRAFRLFLFDILANGLSIISLCSLNLCGHVDFLFFAVIFYAIFANEYQFYGRNECCI